VKRYKHKNHSLQDTGYRWFCPACDKTWLGQPRSRCLSSPSGEHVLQEKLRFFCEKCECSWLSKPNGLCSGLPYREHAFPSALCGDEKVYHPHALADVCVQLKPRAQASATTKRHVKLYAEDMLMLQPPCAKAYVDVDLSFRLNLLEQVYLALQTGKNSKEHYAVLAHCLVVWTTQGLALPALVSGRVMPVGEGRHAILYESATLLEQDLITYRVARKLL